ncbi:MAG: hypothetical protein R2821_09295 [Flavobacteriaceae bacterium]
MLREELADLFPQAEITDIKIPPYIYLQDSTKTGTYVFIDEGFNIGEDELNELLAFVERVMMYLYLHMELLLIH